MTVPNIRTPYGIPLKFTLSLGLEPPTFGCESNIPSLITTLVGFVTNTYFINNLTEPFDLRLRLTFCYTALVGRDLCEFPEEA